MPSLIVRRVVPAVLLLAVSALAAAPPAQAPSSDPLPGVIIGNGGGRQIWAYLQALDPKAGTGAARGDDGKTISFVVLPYTSFSRFGVPGALPDEFRTGDRVRLELAAHPLKKTADTPYLTGMSDEITQQIREDQCWQLASQNRDTYQVSLDKIDRKSGDTLPEKLSLEYGRGTLLVLREDPVYIFRLAPGARVWANTGLNTGSETRTLRETLDEASKERFRKMQELRLLTRADAGGAPAYLTANAAAGAKLRVFPDYAAWAGRLQPGEKLEVTVPGRPAGGPALALRKVELGPVLTLAAPLAGRKVKERVLVRPVRERVDYARDIQPLLEVGCMSCHRQGDARSGYSISTAERMRGGSRRGPGIVPGKPAESMLYLTVSGGSNPRMPPDRDFTPEQQELIRRWIEAGAEVPPP